MSTTAGQPLRVDIRLGCAVVLPAEVAAEAERAAEALLRLTPAPAGNRSWREYHGAFLDRYGPGAVVAVDQLVDPTAGLGFPRHYRDPSPPALATATPERDERLLGAAQQAALDGAQEVVLDDAAINALPLVRWMSDGRYRTSTCGQKCALLRSLR